MEQDVTRVSSVAAPDEKDSLLQRRVSVEAACLTFICLLDLVTTLYWVSQGHAREGNPLMDFFLRQGSVSFIIAKLSLFVPAIVAAEWYRPRKPRMIQRLMRWVIVGYLVLYVAGVAGHYGKIIEFYRELLLG